MKLIKKLTQLFQSHDTPSVTDTPVDNPSSSVAHHGRGRSFVRTAVLFVVLIVLLFIALLMINYQQHAFSITPDPSAQFLREHTRTDITDAQTSAAGQFLIQTTEPIPTEELQSIDEFFAQPPAPEPQP